MKNKLMAGLAIGFFVFCIVNTGNAAPIHQPDYSSLTGTSLITFDDISGGITPGTNYDNIFESNGTLFGEYFDGQTLTYNGDFDVISGTPTGGSLELVAGFANENLNVFSYNGSNVLTGLGNLGYPAYDAIGEGAISILFDYDQSEFGFQLVGGNNGSANIDFYSRNGSVIDSIYLTDLSEMYYGFSREDGVNDIAGISIYNIDAAGIGFDNLLHDIAGVSGPAAPVPEPATMLLFGIGLVGLVGSKIRRKKK